MRNTLLVLGSLVILSLLGWYAPSIYISYYQWMNGEPTYNSILELRASTFLSLLYVFSPVFGMVFLASLFLLFVGLMVAWRYADKSANDK